MPLDINSTAPDFRDFLLKKNLQIPEYLGIFPAGVSAPQIGGQATLDDNINVVIQSPDLSINDLNTLLAKNIKSPDYINTLPAGVSSPVIGSNAPIDDGINLVKPHVNITVDGSFYKDLMIGTNKYGPSAPEPLQTIKNYLPSPNNKGLSGQYDNVSATDYTLPAIYNIDQSKDIINGNLSKNIYKAVDQQVLANINTDVQPVSQYKSYIDSTGNLAVGTPSSLPVNILGSLLNNQGVGIGDNGLVTDFDLRSSLAGRILGGTGIISDTPIGQAGAKYLGEAFINNAMFHTEKETIGLINTNPLSLLKGGDIILPNYDITVPSDSLLNKVDYFGKLLGVSSPLSLLTKTSSIFDSENPIGNIERGNSLINNTGRGQIASLFLNLRENTYQPAFTDNRGKKDGLNQNLYAFDDGKGFVIDLINTPDSNPISQSNYKTLNNDFDSLGSGLASEDLFVNGDFVSYSWEDNKYNKTNGIRNFPSPIFNTPKSILYKTQQLFNTNKMTTLVSGTFFKVIPDETSTLQNGMISKGSAVLNQSKDGFCRAWTTFNRYDKINNLQKHSGINPLGGVRLTQSNSVLQDNGLVKIAPEIDSNGNVEVKNFMFSIENLAWSDNYNDLIPCEQGPGDIITGSQGRIMWFPPYDLSFTDNTSVNWDTTNFIGRGEPIYTYNNTERSGTLQFKVVVDHPSVFNELRFASDKDLIDSVVAGCIPIPARIKAVLTPNELNAIEVKNAQQKQVTHDTSVGQKIFSIYFPNTYSGNLVPFLTYENIPNGTPYGQYTDDLGNQEIDTTNFGLNKEFLDFVNGGTSSPIGKFMTENPSTVIEVLGYASPRGSEKVNIKLAQQRANSAVTYLKSILGLGDDRIKSAKGVGETGILTQSYSSKEEKSARKVDVTIKSDPNKNADLNSAAPKLLTPAEQEKTIEIQSRLYKECDYFYKLEQDNPFIFNHIKEKLKFFSPGFHSTTPEGLNSRLNFLMQCTRQGPTINSTQDSTNNSNTKPDNLAFGRPPVCILRIGDFYHTKIIMENVGFSFDPLVWDLNPEGIGVQPMIVTVDISFKFIGGSSLAGPINRLQNAVSFNYFANTEVYDGRADRIKNGGIERGKAPGNSTIQQTLGTSILNGGLSNNTPVETNQSIVANNEINKNTTSAPTSGTTTKDSIIIATSTSYSSDNEELTLILGTSLGNNIGSDTTGNITLSNQSTPNNTPISLGIITMNKDTNSKTQVYPISLSQGLYHLAIDFGSGIIKRSKLIVI